MAIVTVFEQPPRELREAEEIGAFLERFGIWYRRSDLGASVPEGASAEDVLAAYAAPVEQLKREGGYRTADVIDVHAETPGLRAMLDRFNREHRHDEDEVRFIVAGRGIFHVRPDHGPVFRIEVTAGDLINVPRGTRHWFDLCDESRIRAIRLFQDVSGWTPHYTDSGAEEGFEPLCLGPRYLPPC